MSFAIAALLFEMAIGETYIVGSPNGSWDENTNLQSWIKSQKFRVGDNINFQYGPPHSVVEVTEADYNSCQTSNPVQGYTNGNTMIRLSSPGKRYFICGVTSHCTGGMKIEVDTVPAAPITSSTPPATPLTPPVPTFANPLMPPSPAPPLTPLPPPPPPVFSSQPPTAAPPQPSPTATPAVLPPAPSEAPSVSPDLRNAMVPSTNQPPIVETPEFLSDMLSPSSPPRPPLSSANKEHFHHLILPMGLGFGLAMILGF
ncbi:hypothetical protein Scep_013112 [Stephania cephalantha]|uniref:Phytocyanin domain-containing protein n=1 Tax=Stephania cephalantha TaxID=152367 RepID=A0AAP0P868_9MAGN